MEGGDHDYTLSGILVPTGHNLSADVAVDLVPGASGNLEIAGRFAMNMIGTSADDRLELYGTGPLGIIIQMNATRRPPGVTPATGS